MRIRSHLGAILLLCLAVLPARAEYLLRFAPPIGLSQDFDVEVDGSASARGKDFEFRGGLTLNQIVAEAPEGDEARVSTSLTILDGLFRYNDDEEEPRYIGEPFTADRTKLGVITHVSHPFEEDDRTGIDVTSAILYATSLLALPERPTRPGKDWDGSHDAFDPYGDYVEVSAENSFLDLLELEHETLIDVTSKGSFPYRVDIEGRSLSGKLEYVLHSKLDLATGALRESDLVLTGSLKTRAYAQTFHITVHRLHVHAVETKNEILSPEELAKRIAPVPPAEQG